MTTLMQQTKHIAASTAHGAAKTGAGIGFYVSLPVAIVGMAAPEASVAAFGMTGIFTSVAIKLALQTAVGERIVKASEKAYLAGAFAGAAAVFTAAGFAGSEMAEYMATSPLTEASHTAPAPAYATPTLPTLVARVA